MVRPQGLSDRAKLVVGLLSGNAELFLKVKNILEKAFGRVDFESGILDFKHTDYYRKELGDNLKRKFFSFERLLGIKDICKAKLRTVSIERRFSKNGRRTVNIDPGYVDLAKLVLFSTKDYSHRIYLANGIFAEVTLFFKDGAFRAWPWTYPDYKTNEYIAIFNHIRDIYRDQKRG